MSVFFFTFSSISLIYNLIPEKEPIKLENGDLTYNDGQLLLDVLKQKKKINKYISAINIYNEKKYSEAILLFNDFLKNGFDSQITYRFLIASHLQLNNYSEAKTLIEESTIKHEQNSDDYYNAGLTYSQLELHHEALTLYDKALENNISNFNAYNNKGYTLNLLEKYHSAILMFNRAIEIDPNQAYPYNNRGLAKIKLGQSEEGLKDLKKGKKLDPTNSYYYKNMGTYYYDNNQYKKALELFEKAKQMDASTYKIDDDIEKTRKLV